jgi:hypothetical protein
MEVGSSVVAALAFLFSVVSFVMSYRQKKELQAARKKLDSALFDLERDMSFEGRLADWPEAFKLHGVDVEAAKREGLTPGQIAYMILSVNGLISYCTANGLDIYTQLKNSEYRKRMFAQRDTRLAWRYARLCIPKETAMKIDKYVKETHGDEYSSL